MSFNFPSNPTINQKSTQNGRAYSWTGNAWEIASTPVSGSGYVDINLINDTYIISVTGLQPTGIYASGTHSHLSSDITNFNTSVSGLLPVKNISAGSGINVANNSENFTISVTGNFGLTSEEVDDRVNDLLKAGSYVNLSYDDFNNSLTIAVTGLQPSGNYSVVGHTHTSSQITDFNSSVSGLLPVKNITGGSYISVSSSSGNYTISSTGLQPSGNYSVIGHNHNSSDITNFNSSVSGLLPSVTGTGYVVSSFNNNVYSVSITGLQPSGNYSIIGHNHSSSDIIDFNSALSGLLPVKQIVAGTGIDITNTSGTYTINSSSTISSDTLEPDGFVNRTDSFISFDNNSRQFSIAPKNPATSYTIYSNGVKIIKNSTESITLPNSTALYFLHFDKSNNSLSYKTTGFDFDSDIPIAHIYYNADDGKAVYFGEERHGIRMDSATHKYLHNVFGTQYINGLSISNYTLTGDGSNNSDATIAISNGLIYDEDIDANITHSNSPSNPFEQILYPIAQIPVYYKSGASGAWTDTTANNYPVKTGTTIQYNLLNGGSWSASNSDNPSNSRFIAYWICATTQENAPVISIMGQRLDSSLLQSQSNNTWNTLNLVGLPIVELRPLYRVIYETKNSFSNSPKGFLVDILDIRGHVDTISGATQNDHGSLYGLADDDHPQYVHIDNPRTITANHTLSNGLTISSGLLSATSGSFTLLNVNGTGVSLNGHTHVSSNITDFNGSVSGLLPSVNGSGYITSSFANNVYTIGVNGLQPSGNYSLVGHTHSSSNIIDFNSSVSGLVNGIYAPLNSPSLTGIPTTPTATSGTNTTQIASTAFVRTEISNLVNSAPSTLDTLNELASALGNDSNFATTVTNNIATKVSKNGDTMTGALYAPSGIFTSGVNIGGIPVSISGHNHSSSNITDFSSSVSGLLPSISGTGYISSSFTNNTYTLTINGLQPSGDYSLVGHTHISSNITDFNSAVSGLLPVTTITGSGYATVSNVGTTYTIGVTGLQPSGNYSLANHTHTSSNITDFNSGVSGLLPITNIIGGANISVVPSGTTFNISVSGSLGLTTEEVDDRVSSLLVAGTGINLNYNDNLNILTVSTSGLQPSGNYSLVGHTHTSSDITNFNNSVSGLLPTISGSGYIISSFNNNTYAISASGLQPSGNYSLVGHTHTKSEVGLSNVDNTSDINKPISSATQTALNTKMPLASPVYSLGTVSGSIPIDFGSDRLIQTLTLNGTATTFTKGSGWPVDSTSVDVVLRTTVSSATSITWSIVTDWFNQPTVGALASGTHLILLRAVGSSIIEGHYIGNKTN